MIDTQKQFDCADMRTDTIKELFYRQISAMTLKSTEDLERTLDMQFSDRWIN